MDTRRREVHRTFAGLGFSREASVTGGIRYQGTLSVSGRKVRAAISFDDLEFARLPRLSILHPAEDTPSLLAHVQSDGDYCYAHRDAFVLDRFDISTAIAQSMQLMRSSLERSQTSHATAEIAGEFPQHWFGHPVGVDLKDALAGRATLFQIPQHNKTQLVVLADSKRVVRLLSGAAHAQEESASIVPTSRALTFRPGQTRPETFEEFLTWLSSIDAQAASGALNAARASHPNRPLIFLSAPNGMVGVRLEFVPAYWKSFTRPAALARYVEHHPKEVKLTRFTAEPIDPTFLYTRNMGTQTNLGMKRIVLVGCGTIGSHLAKMLAQSGAGFGNLGALFLVDEQDLKAGNIGRHLLGIRHVGMNKAVAVRDVITEAYPELDVSAISGDVLKHLHVLDQADLVIDATGDEGISNALNAHLMDRRKRGVPSPAVIFTFLFGNGAAAQALCADSSEFACYKCLRPDHGGPWRFSPLKSGYDTQEIAAACGEAPYFPYGVAAPVTAAALALQLAFDWVKGDASPRLRTVRLAFDETQQVRDQNPARLERCLACGMEQ